MVLQVDFAALHLVLQGLQSLHGFQFARDVVANSSYGCGSGGLLRGRAGVDGSACLD